MKITPRSERRWSPVRVRVLACALALLPTVAARAQEKIGYVFDVKGEWSLDGNPSTRLGRAAALPSGGVIRLRAASGVGTNYIVVADISGVVIGRRECDEPESCQPVVLPRTVRRSPSMLSRLYARIMDRFGRRPDTYAAAISRSAGGEMQEAVVLLAEGKVDLSPAFEKMGAGKYLLRVESLGDGSGETAGPLEFAWNPVGENAVMEVKGLRQGLYRLSLLDAKDLQPLGGGMDAWILVCEPDTYRDTSSDFREVSGQTAAWKSQVSRATVRSFLRAYLDELSERK